MCPLSRYQRLFYRVYCVEEASSGAMAAGAGRRRKADPMTDKTNRISSVEVMIPPITTVASGRWISLPTPVEIAIGTKAAASTEAH